MSTQPHTPLVVQPKATQRLSDSDLAISIDTKGKPTLQVLRSPDPPPPDNSAERDRQASLELLHRQVMG